MGIYKANSSSTMTASSLAVIEAPCCEEEGIGSEGIAGETNRIPILITLSFISSFRTPVGLREAPLKNISHTF